MKLLIISILLLLASQPSDHITGKAIRVSDGNTIKVVTNKDEQYIVKLYGIDAPDLEQSFGEEAYELVSRLCLDRKVHVEKKKGGKKNVIHGVVWAGDINVNEELLRSGLAWHYRMIDNSPRYHDFEKDAKEKELNIWSEKNPTAPWIFRKTKKKNTEAL
ncbi:thermonuclease family protein [Porphyromonadaceae bacterium OttesenSCG-928-L07]|nr:thermonuclease family protein [Porphyromonadaceae bacterium OttesenSCG-928-L07]MDL2252345.1 thermonuclease family protein [Odoribacter sp. OttesenSCG-928-J03]